MPVNYDELYKHTMFVGKCWEKRLTKLADPAIISIYQLNKWVNEDLEVTGVSTLFEKLLRSNFRCGRMLNSRAGDMAGSTSMPCLRSW